MPLPAIAVAAIPWVASAVGSLLPAIVDAFRSGKSPEEAQKLIEPKKREIIDRLVGTGMNQEAAEAMAAEQLKGELEKAQLPEPMNPWLQGALAIGGGIGGFKLGKMAAGRMTPGTVSSKPTVQPDDGMAAMPSADVYTPGFTSPRAEAMRRGAGDRVTGIGEPARIGHEAPIREVEAEIVSGPFPQMDRRFATEYVGNPMFPPPGVTRGRGFTMRDAPMGPFPNVEMSPELANRYAADAIRGRVYRYEGG